VAASAKGAVSNEASIGAASDGDSAWVSTAGSGCGSAAGAGSIGAVSNSDSARVSAAGSGIDSIDAGAASSSETISGGSVSLSCTGAGPRAAANEARSTDSLSGTVPASASSSACENWNSGEPYRMLSDSACAPGCSGSSASAC
jgi:hypothetical protein